LYTEHFETTHTFGYEALIEEAFEKFYNSELCRKLDDIETGLFVYSLTVKFYTGFAKLFVIRQG